MPRWTHPRSRAAIFTEAHQDSIVACRQFGRWTTLQACRRWASVSARASERASERVPFPRAACARSCSVCASANGCEVRLIKDAPALRHFHLSTPRYDKT
jgi:hypothetical protein